MPEAGTSTSTVSHGSSANAVTSPPSAFTTTNTRTNKVFTFTSPLSPGGNSSCGSGSHFRSRAPQTSGDRWNAVVRMQRWFRHWRSGRRSIRLHCILQVLLGKHEQNEFFSASLLQRAEAHLKKDKQGVAWAALQSLLQVSEAFDYALRQENDTRHIMVMELEKSNPSWRQASPATKRIMRQSHPALRYCAVLSPDLFREHVLKELANLFDSYLRDVEEEWEQVVVEEQTLAQESARREQEMVKEMKSLMSETLLPRYTDYLIDRFSHIPAASLSSCSKSRTVLLKAFDILMEPPPGGNRMPTIKTSVPTLDTKSRTVSPQTTGDAKTDTTTTTPANNETANEPAVDEVVLDYNNPALLPLPMSEYSTIPTHQSSGSTSPSTAALATTPAAVLPHTPQTTKLPNTASSEANENVDDGNEDEEDDLLFEDNTESYSDKSYFAHRRQHEREVRARIEKQLQYSGPGAGGGSKKMGNGGGGNPNPPEQGTYTKKQLSAGIGQFGELEDGLQLLGFRRGGEAGGKPLSSHDASDEKSTSVPASRTLLSEVQQWSGAAAGGGVVEPQPDEDDGDVDTFMTKALGKQKPSTGTPSAMQYRCAICELTGVLRNSASGTSTAEDDDDAMERCHGCSRPVHLGCAAEDAAMPEPKNARRFVFCCSSCAARKS